MNVKDRQYPRFGYRTAAPNGLIAKTAERFLEQAALGSGSTLPSKSRALIERFLAITGDPDEAAAELRALATDSDIALGPALDLFETRTGFLAARGIDVSRVRFSTAFGRGFDYYTGFVFELADPARADGKPVAGGGRYDRLLSMIRTRNGTGVDIPAVGFALWLDRLGVPTP